MSSLKVEAIIRGGIRRFTDMVGQLWCSLADYHVRAGRFERVSTFSLLYNQTFGSNIIVRVCFYFYEDVLFLEL